MGHSIESIARSIAFGLTSISRKGIKRYIEAQKHDIECATKYGRSARQAKIYLKAGLRALELLDETEENEK